MRPENRRGLDERHLAVSPYVQNHRPLLASHPDMPFHLSHQWQRVFRDIPFEFLSEVLVINSLAMLGDKFRIVEGYSVHEKVPQE